jgi:hypothetical protein
MDPLFWVAHGAMERIFQKSVFAGIFSDMVYSTVDHCEGHSAQSVKSWLNGYYFEDESVDTSTLTNAELIGILDPSSDKYRDYLNFVYDTFSFDWCSSSDSWFTKRTL